LRYSILLLVKLDEEEMCCQRSVRLRESGNMYALDEPDDCDTVKQRIVQDIVCFSLLTPHN